jgi:hypothetical protein
VPACAERVVPNVRRHGIMLISAFPEILPGSEGRRRHPLKPRRQKRDPAL